MMKSPFEDINKINDPNNFVIWLTRQLRSNDDIPMTFGERLDWEVIVKKWDEVIDAANRIAKVHQPVPAADYISPLQLEARLCVWEELSMIRTTGQGVQNTGLSAALAKLWDDYGSVHMRLEITPIIADFALKLYEDERVKESVRDRAGWSYDWQFIPFIVALFKDVDGDTLKVPDFNEAVHAVLLETWCPLVEMDQEEIDETR